MGKKYLDTKKNTLEASILDVWKEAAKLNEYKTKLGEKRRVAGGDMRRTENKKLKESTFKEEKHEYEKFFNAAMKKFKINSPADLKSDEEKKKFFDYIDKNYKSSAEKKTGKEDPTEKDKEKIGEDFQKQHEFKMQSMKDAIQKVWEMSDREKIETKRARSVPTRPGKTMTGDDASVVTVNPKVKS
tara:strand:+ start:1277 stop:1834 length:558 start_codon:yes stop_codon:yes gene_type:complete